MRMTKDLILQIVEVKARQKLAQLACEIVRAESHDREMILAGLEFERWLADSCRDCRFGS